MAKWTDMGAAMRRRIGAPSNHLESAGNGMARSHMTSDEAHEVAKNANSARVALGDGPINNPLEVLSPEQNAPLKGTLVPKKSTQSADPTYGGKANRVNVQEKIGATYRVNAAYTAMVDPTAGATMANARIVPSVLGRQNPNFQGGIQDSSI
jgi:hypothetical protein